MEESAEIDDGYLDSYSLEVKNLWKLALMLRSFRSGTHGHWRESRTAKCIEFNIETNKPMPVNTDGEIVTATPAHFKVHPKAISIFAPKLCIKHGRSVPTTLSPIDVLNAASWQLEATTQERCVLASGSEHFVGAAGGGSGPLLTPEMSGSGQFYFTTGGAARVDLVDPRKIRCGDLPSSRAPFSQDTKQLYC